MINLILSLLFVYVAIALYIFFITTTRDKSRTDQYVFSKTRGFLYSVGWPFVLVWLCYILSLIVLKGIHHTK